VDYRKLAEELGGRAEPQPQTETPAVDYRALAEQYGGVQEEEEAQSLAFEEPAPERFTPPEEPFIEKTQNPLKGFVARSAGLGGAAAEVPDTFAQLMSNLTGLPKDQIFELPVDTVGKSFADKALDYERDIGYAPSTQLGDIADNPLTIFPFIAERIITSIPDMAAAYAAAPAYVAARTNEILKERVKNDDKTLAEATVGDVAASAAAATFEAMFERFATGRLLRGAGVTGKTAPGRIAKETAIQGGTEFAEEVGAYAGETAGTKRGFDVEEAGLAGLEGMIVGGGLGAGAQTAKEVLGRKASDTPEDRAIADLDKLAADEEAEAAGTELVSEEDLFAEEAAGRIAPEDTVPATLEELKKLDKDLKKKLGRVPTTEEVERALYDFESEKTRRLRAESGGGEPSVSVSSAEEIIAGTAKTPTRIEPTGLGTGVEPVISTGTRKEPTLGPLTPAVNPEDTFIIRDIAGTYNEGLINYFRTYYGLKPESMPKAASVAMPLLQRADQLLARYSEAMLKSNQPHLDEPIGSMSRLGMAKTTMLPEYQKASRLAPGGLANRLIQKAMALDKGYKRANQSQFDGAVKEMQVSLNEFEQALGTLPPPISDAEKQTLRQKFEEGVASSIPKVPKKRQLAALVNLLRREPERLSKAPRKAPIYTPAREDPARLQEAIEAGLITQQELDALQKQSDDFFAAQPTEPTGVFTEAQQKLKDALDSNGKIFIDSTDEAGKKTYYAKGIGSTNPIYQVELELTPEERRAAQIAEADIELADTPEEREAGRKALVEALRPAAERATRQAAPTEPTATPQTRSEEIAKLAAELGGVPGDEGGVRPARDDEGGETIKAKAGANVRRLSKLLGPKLYGEPSQMPFVSVKEMVQNSFDAIKPMQEKGQLVKGKIDITVDPTTRIISVKDNGTGMSPETLSTTFLTIAGTKKEGERDSGGLGIAKMQFLFNNDSIRVITLRDGVASELVSTGDQLEESMENPSLSPDITVWRGDNIPSSIKGMFPDGHGTYAEVLVPATYKDTASGKDIDIEIRGYSGSYRVLRESPLFSDIDVEFNGIPVDIGSKFPYEDYTTFANVNFDWGTARIYVSKDTSYFYSDNVAVLSNGLWQFSETIKANKKTIQRQIYVDVSPKKEVKAEDARYPFDLNRQRFSPAVSDSFDKIFKYLSVAYAAADFASDVKDFGSIQYLNKEPSGKITTSDSIKLAPPLKSDIFRASEISEGDQIEVRNGILYVKNKKVPELTDDDLKSTSIEIDDLKIDESLINKDQVMLHINVNIGQADKQKLEELKDKKEVIKDEMWDKYSTFNLSNITDDAERNRFRNLLDDIEEQIKKAETGEVKPITEVGREKFGDKFDGFLFDIGNEFLKLRNFVATLDPEYSSLLPKEAVGVSLDEKYRGVNIVVPFRGVFINPFATRYTDTSRAASGVWYTMVHELAHVKERSHDDDFAAEMQNINLMLEASVLDGNPTWLEIKKNISQIFTRYKDVFEYFNKELKDGNFKAIGKRLSSSSEEQIRDGGVDSSGAGFRGAREGEPEISRRIDLRSENIGEERERSRDAGEASLSELEQRVIQLSLGGGDIHPTMISAIANNDLKGALIIASQKLSGFSADLARTLSELNLPTNISFNTGRELVRRSVDNASQPQQERLFKYVRMHYPQVYDKYFKNYDRSESLELVAQGLVELQKPNYKLGPVIAEFGTVAGAYKKYIEGLTSPGAYYPDFDEIVLDTNTLTGKSYRVFLHEVVHAATEYALNTYKRRPQDLSPGQRDAVEELTAMYDFAVEKIGTTPYGMTNIYEFIAEVFTNRKFQDTLKNIKYEPKKAPFFSRLVRTILKMFGLDNLAGNAMAEATKIFSAVRSQDTLSRGPRFAKSGPKTARVKGPISTPQTWRTAEDMVNKAISAIENSIKGRRSWEEVSKIISPSMWDTGTGAFRSVVLGVLNLRQIDDLTKTKFPEISGAIRIIEKMLAYRGKIMKSAEDIVTKWTKAQAKKPKQSQLLGRIMLEATIRGIDPDKPGAKPMNAALVQAWNRLDPEFKEIYREVRDFYSRAVNNMVREMKLRVAKSTLTLSEKKAAVREINSKFGPDKLVQPYFPLRRFGKYFFQVGERNNKEFYMFENRFIRDMAMRKRRNELSTGNVQQRALATSIEMGNGLSELFNQNLNTTQVLKEAQDIIDNVTATTVVDAKKEMKDSLNQLIYILLPQQSMRKMFINRKAIQGASGDMLRVFATSAVHSAYQQSRFKFAESFIKNLQRAREHITPENGFTTERSLVYKDYITEVEKRVPTILSNEDTSLAAVAAGKASELTFLYMLSAPFSAMLNVLGVAQLVMPYIGGRYGYVKTNALMLKNFQRYFATAPSRTMAPLATGSIMQMQFPSIVEGGKLTGVLKQAADRFLDDNQVNISLTNDLMDMSGRPSELYTGRYNMVKKMLSGLFHQSERLGREVTLLTTFELAYEKFSKSPKKDLRGVIDRDAQGNPIMNTPEEAFELAIAEATSIAGLALGDFTRQMKPRFFTPPLLSVLTKFKQYSVLATYAIVRNFYFTVAAPFRKKEIEEFRQQMLKDKLSPQVIEQRIAEADAQRKELYREGRRRLAGILAVTYLLGGNEASPFYSIGIGTIVKLLANEDDDEFFDWENWVKNYMEEELGGAAGDLFAEMGMNPETAESVGRSVGSALQRGVVTELTGGELAGRVSLDPKNMWYREGGYSPDIRESIVDDVIANAGPVVGLGFNWVDAYRLFQEGQYQRAFERAAPALVSKPVTAARIATEDARTARGDKLAENFSAWELAMQAIGLQPTRLAQAQKSAIESKTYEQKVEARINTLLDRLWLERDNTDGFNETLERIMEFNSKYPNHFIGPETITDSFERRAEGQAMAEAIGGRFDKKSTPKALEMLRYGRE
jgi:hypothetical protein